jgi:Ala-tRNA(Pro) deacylase
MQSTFDKILQHLQETSTSYKQVEHSAAKTCEQSALARGEDLAIGGKTLLFKSKRNFHLFVTSAATEVDSTKVRKILRSQKLRFASTEELMQLAGVEKGALPPYGKGVLSFDLYIDLSILKNKMIAYNAGRLTTSHILDLNDYLRIVSDYAYFARFSK